MGALVSATFRVKVNRVIHPLEAAYQIRISKAGGPPPTLESDLTSGGLAGINDFTTSNFELFVC